MITNNGKDIIGKFMLGQIPNFATHIAIGCGAVPLKTTDSLEDITILQAKDRLDFEMTRAPIVSKGFVDQTYQYAITNKSLTSNVATLTIGSHVLQVGDSVSVNLDTADPIFDGTYRVSAVTSTTISYISNNPTNVISVSATGTLVGSKTKVSFTAALPSENKYEITEVGLWSAPNNVLATGQDSHILFSFQDSWQAHGSSVVNPIFKNNLGTGEAFDYSVVPEKIFYASTSNVALHSGNRRDRKEGPRFGNNTLFVRGDTCEITGSTNNWVANDMVYDVTYVSLVDNVATIETSQTSSINIGDTVTIEGVLVDTFFNGIYTVTAVNVGSKSFSFALTHANVTRVARTGTVTVKAVHVHLNNVNFNISENSASDILTLAFSVIDKTSIGTETPDSVKILLEFYKNEISLTAGFAKKEIEVPYEELLLSSHQSISFPISELITSTDFSANDISICRIFSSVIVGGNPSPDHFLTFDGLRLDNITVENPVYKMSGYSIVQNIEGYPIIKLSNSNNYIEFRFTLGIS